MRQALRTPRAGAWLLVALAMVLSAAPAIAGPFTRLQVLLPGESAAPGTVSGKSGTPSPQTVGYPYTVTVRACDDTWTTVTTVTDVVSLLSSDKTATFSPATAQLASGVGTYTVTMNAAGTYNVQAHDETDGTIPDAFSSLVTVYALNGFTFAKITQKNQYAGTPMATTVTAVDPNGNVVVSYSGPVTLKEITSYGDGRISPSSVTLTNGVWNGSVTMYRADETSINRGNVNLYAYDANFPSKNGTSDPFTVHPGTFARVQIVLPGQTRLPGSVAGVTGSPATQAAGRGFTVTAYGTDAYWNTVPVTDNVRITSSDLAANTPQTGALLTSSLEPFSYRQFTITLNTVGTQTLTVSDATNGSIQGMTSAGIQVIPSAADHFAIAAIASPQTAGSPVTVSIQAVDSGGNLVPGYVGDANLQANTGAGSVTPSLITFAGGLWSGPVTFFGAGGAVALTCSDFSSPPHTGTSASFVVQPGPLAGLQVILPGETAQGGTADGKIGTPTGQTAGAPFMLTVRAVDAYWNLVSGVNDLVKLGSTDQFATMPADTTLANGQIVLPVRLYKSGGQQIWASDSTQSSVKPDTSAVVNITGGTFSRVLILAPGESPAPGTTTGRTGTATDQSINYAFTVTILATDQWWNPVGGVSDMVHLTSGDPLAQLGADQAMVNGVASMSVKLATGGYQLISVSDVTNSSIQGSTTQVRAISSGFHLEASVTPTTAPAGGPFTLTVKVTNDAGSVIQEINSFVTIEVQNASTRLAGKGTLLTTQFQLLQGQRSVTENYTFAEPIILIAHDDAGNAPAATGVITIVPGAPAAIRLTSSPPWVGGNKHATINARVVDAFQNGVPGQPVAFSLLAGTGTLTALTDTTNATGNAQADFLSPRQPENDQIRATSGVLTQDLTLQVAFVDPNAGGGYVTNYPNPFHPPAEGTTIAYKLADMATVTLRIYTSTGTLVRREVFSRGSQGGLAGLNTYVWDGKNGDGKVVASGGYIAFIEAQGTGETLHVIRRKIAVVR